MGRRALGYSATCYGGRKDSLVFVNALIMTSDKMRLECARLSARCAEFLRARTFTRYGSASEPRKNVHKMRPPTESEKPARENELLLLPHPAAPDNLRPTLERAWSGAAGEPEPGAGGGCVHGGGDADIDTPACTGFHWIGSSQGITFPSLRLLTRHFRGIGSKGGRYRV